MSVKSEQNSAIRRDCVLYERACIQCGECDQCDLDPEKICDNCMRCVRSGAEFAAIRIDGVLNETEALDGEEPPR